jgi:hypothetical protein
VWPTVPVICAGRAKIAFSVAGITVAAGVLTDKASASLKGVSRDGGSMPVYLSFLICALSGGACHVTIPAERAFVGLSACQMEGMMITPQWQEQHPGWTVRRIRCSIGSRPHDEEVA